MRRFLRIVSTVMIVGGIGACLWAVVVWQWQDPFTALYTTYEQHQLASRYDKQLASYKPVDERPIPAVTSGVPGGHTSWVSQEEQMVALAADRYRKSLKIGQPLGRIKVPRLGIDMLLVTGTDHDSLTKGPGWYTGTYLPGEGQLIYIAGHRTTYLAPFAAIDTMRPGDRVTIELPYATFVYETRYHAIVTADDVSRLKSHGHELLALQACHPRFFATHRYIVYAVPIKVIPRVGRPYSLQPPRVTAGSNA